MIHDGERKVVLGNGISTLVFADPWMPTSKNPYVTTNGDNELADIKVASLMNSDGLRWIMMSLMINLTIEMLRL